MHLDKSKLREEGYIGEELIDESGISAIDRKCFVVKQTITDGDFTLEQALEAYGVTKEEFNKYLTNHFIAEFYQFFPQASSIQAVTSGIAIIVEMYKAFLGGVDKDAPNFQKHLEQLSKDISTGKVAF